MSAHPQEEWIIGNEEVPITGYSLSRPITLFDGKNFIVPVIKKDPGLHELELLVIEFWGPYSDLDNETNTRWAEAEVDVLTIANEGPRFRVLKRIPLRFSGENILITRMENKTNEVWVYVQSTTPTYFVLSTTTYEFVNKVVEPLPGSDIPLVQVPDENGVLFTPESPIYQFGSFRWAVGLAPLQQFGEDRQKLYRYTMSGETYVYAGFTYIPGRKQFNPREMALQWGKVWVTGFNTSSIHGFDVTNGNFFTSVSINRDVSKIYAKNNKLYTLSRGGLCHEISEALNVTPVGNEGFFDSLKAVDILPQQLWQDVGAAYWYAPGGTPNRVINVNKTTFVGQVWGTYFIPSLVAYNPPMTYQFFDGSIFQTIQVKEYLLLGQRLGQTTSGGKTRAQVTLKAYRLRDLYRGISSLTHSAYTAISLGPLSYKGDNC